MTRRFSNLRIGRKLTLITMLISGVALLLACSSFAVYEQRDFRRTMARDFAIIADMFDDNIAGGLAFDDTEGMAKTLKTLSANPHIEAAGVFDKTGKLVADYQRTDLGRPFKFPAAQATSQQFTRDRLDTFQDITLAGETIGVVYFSSDLREIRQRAWRYGIVVGALLLGCSLVALLLAAPLQKIISRPIEELAVTAALVATGKNYSVRAVKQSEDEVGRLVDGFNAMLSQIQARDTDLQHARDELEHRVETRTAELRQEIADRKKAEAELEVTHRQLIDTSRQAGMAEVATGVLHNVGNVLNSVNVSATLVMDCVRQTKAASVAKLAALFDQHKANLGDFFTNDPRGQKIPGYLGILAKELAAEHEEMVVELEHLRKNIDHIKDIVAMQQNYARNSGFMETVSLPDLIEDALRMNAGSLARHQVNLVRDYQTRPVVTVDKHKVIQILINLVGNAKHACDESGRSDKLITVRTTSDEGCIRIAVSDNGVGIPPENLTRIFNHGFTTRKTGHGFGLHSGALAARELGGSLSVQSEGPGHGAIFILELPAQPEAAVHA